MFHFTISSSNKPFLRTLSCGSKSLMRYIWLKFLFIDHNEKEFQQELFSKMNQKKIIFNSDFIERNNISIHWKVEKIIEFKLNYELKSEILINYCQINILNRQV
jgi:hypothetical protein